MQYGLLHFQSNFQENIKRLQNNQSMGRHMENHFF